ncbi:MAG: FAD-linked oxidase C-terminal domain-containing protein [Pseudomonadota bacterium]|nr:FAD-linked oxidase C-terminal domain-containing protein [Pseudomonadota bacterium]
MDGKVSQIKTTIDILRQRFGNRLSTNQTIRDRHGTDESYHAPSAPDAVVFPDTREEVQDIVKICGEHDTPIIPFGVGTSLEGHIAALRGGISIDLGKMNAVVQVNTEDLDVTVEAGVTRKQLNEHLRDTGLFFPIDPGADATIGGMSATRASGTNAVRYGTMRDNVLSLGVVLPDGQYIRTGKRARKSSAGYDLTRLFVGSEGTLGVISDITLRLYGIPETISSAVCTYPTVEDAVNMVILTIQSGVPIARIELIDEVQMQALNKFAGLGYAERPTLFFEFHGTKTGVAEQIEGVRAISDDFGGTDFAWASKPEDRSKLWQARHDAHYANMQLRPGTRAWATDVCVPISRLAECISETRRDIEESGLLAPIVGHVGDGNFHVDMVLDPDDAGEVSRAVALNERLVSRALSMDGTCTGEHGVGHGKIDKLVEEHGNAAIDVMRSLKQAVDPKNLMNPGKIVRL